MYRIKRKFAWLPKKVWKRKNAEIGEWVTIWWREWYIVEKLDVQNEIEGYYPENWIYYCGDYFFQLDAEQLAYKKNYHSQT